VGSLALGLALLPPAPTNFFSLCASTDVNRWTQGLAIQSASCNWLAIYYYTERLCSAAVHFTLLQIRNPELQRSRWRAM
jgi:hypothetical protein